MTEVNIVPKFKYGDRVVAVNKNNWVPVGTVGTVVEDSVVPFVEWDNGNVYCLRESEMKLYSPAIKKGDRIRLTTDKYEEEWELPKGTEGTVFAIRETGSVDVDFDNWNSGHDGETGDHHVSSHLYVRPDELEKTEKQKGNIVLFRQGNKVIAKLTYGKSIIHTAEATCNPEDTFDFLLGSQIALQRLIEMIRGEDMVIAIPSDTSFDEVFVY